MARGVVASAPPRQERLSVERAHREMVTAGVLFGPLGPKLGWVKSKLWQIGCLDLFPHQNLLRGVAAFTKLRTFCSPGSF